METATILFFSASTSFLFLCVGIVAGWTAKDFMHDYFGYEEEQATLHPEMYDHNGQYINEELLSVRFVEDEEDEAFDE